MAYSIEKLPGEPIIIARIGADFDLTSDWAAFNQELNALLNALQEPAFYITDVLRATFGFDDLVAGVNLSARGSKPVLKHPSIRESLVVTNNSFFKMAARGLSSVTFGNIAMKTFDDLGACLRYCRQ